MTAHPSAARFILASALALAASTAAALDPAKRITQYGHDVWQIEQGLPHNTVRAIAQTSDGYLWLGTLEGLVRFDGVRFTVFDANNTPGLPDSAIGALLGDRTGALWIGTESGLVRYRDGRFEPYPFTGVVAALSVTALAEGADGTVWVGTQVEGVLQVKGSALVGYPGLSGPPGRTVSALHVDRAGRLWIGSRVRGAATLDEGKVREYSTADGLPSNDVRCFAGAGDGSVWIGTEQGLGRLDANGRVQAGPPAGSTRALHLDRHGSLWVGTSGEGVARVNGAQVQRYSKGDGLSSLAVRTFLEDREGSLWVGLADGGLARFRDGPLTTIGQPEGLAEEVVIGLAADAEDAVWAGTRGGGLHRIQGGGITRLTTRDGLASDTVVAIAAGAGGTTWAGTIGDGITRLDGRGARTFRTKDGLVHDDVFALRDEGPGGLWIGTRGGGLGHYDGTRFASYGRAQGLASSFVWDLARDRSGALWIASAHGLYTLAGGAIRTVVPDIPAHSIHLDADGVAWVGTSRRGLHRVKDGRDVAFTASQGLQNDNVTQVLEDHEGHLWLGSNQGISRVAKRQLDDLAEGRIARLTPAMFDNADGMRSRECNYGRGARTSDGRLWFPTIRGVVVVDPRRVRPNTVRAPVHVERVVANGREVPRDVVGGAVVPPGEGRLEFHFTALSYLAPQRVRFSHRLEGFEAEWSAPDTRREATFTNLPPGRYTFRVRATNSDGIWNEEGASFPVRLQPHFHQTLWFAALVAAAVAAVAWRVHHFRTQRLVEMERVRTRIAADLHDDIGAGLSQIAVLSEVAAQRLPAAGGVGDALGKIAGTAGELIDSMSDIVWAVNPRNDRLEDLVRRMRELVSEVSSARGLQMGFQASGVDGQVLSPDLRRHVYLIFKEGLSNAARHSGGTRVDVALAVSGGRLALRLADDGRGFDRSQPSDGNGLTTMTRRAVELGGRAEITCPAAGGTVLTLDVPLGR